MLKVSLSQMPTKLNQYEDLDDIFPTTQILRQADTVCKIYSSLKFCNDAKKRGMVWHLYY